MKTSMWAGIGLSLAVALASGSAFSQTTTKSVSGWVGDNAAAAANAQTTANNAVPKGSVGSESVTANNGAGTSTTQSVAGWVAQNAASAAAAQATAKSKAAGSYLDFSTYPGFDPTNTTDQTAPLNKFLADCVASGAFCRLPAGVYLVTGELDAIGGPLRLRVDRAQVSKFQSQNYSTVQAPGSGTWLHLAHTGRGLVLDRSSDGSAGGPTAIGIVFGSEIVGGLGFYRDQPAPVTGQAFVPLSTGFDLSIRNTAAAIDVVDLNGSYGVEFVNAGKSHITKFVGQPLINGIVGLNNYDVIDGDDVEMWPYWSFHDSVKKYTTLNTVGIRTGRADGFHLKYVFDFQHAASWQIEPYSGGSDGSPAGTTYHGRIETLYSDSGASAVKVLAGADNATASVGELISQPPDSAPISSGGYEPMFVGQPFTAVVVTANGVELDIDHGKFNFGGANDVLVTGTGSVVNIGRALIGSWDRNGTASTPAFLATGTGSRVTVGAYSYTAEYGAMSPQQVTFGTGAYAFCPTAASAGAKVSSGTDGCVNPATLGANSYTDQQTAPKFAVDGNLSVSLANGNPLIALGPNGFITYDRTNKMLSIWTPNGSSAIDVADILGNATYWHNTLVMQGGASVAGGLSSDRYSVGSTAGVSCSGAPTASYAVTNGIVTHC